MSAPTAPTETAESNQIRIFVDMDGVLANFLGHARAEGKYKPSGKLNYEELDYKWWATMPTFVGAKAFYDEACATGKVNFLTGPVLNEECYSGKAHWVEAFVPERKHILEDLIICDAVNKFLLARPDRILIDDSKENVDAWVAAGGIGIQHKGNYVDTLKKLKEAVAKLTPPPPAKKRQLRGAFPKPR